ncbi:MULTISPECIES: hypothetical protein [unclassified Sphingobacterium]|uniref:hypothetical protein n=1 Tax=unclassified Sphingobacterium TaxID=2609468 RepID=UPI0025F86B12|nr:MULTISPECIES: hypothetical protein [unclassified Sphingobacterium]
MTKNLKNIYYNFEEGNYGLKFVFDLDGLYLLFDSTTFIYTDAPEFDGWRNWNKLIYKELGKDSLHITEIKEDELTSYFVKLSNRDVFYIYQHMDLEGTLHQNFTVVSPKEGNYSEVLEYMEEEWIETLLPGYIKPNAG